MQRAGPGRDGCLSGQCRVQEGHGVHNWLPQRDPGQARLHQRSRRQRPGGDLGTGGNGSQIGRVHALAPGHPASLADRFSLPSR